MKLYLDESGNTGADLHDRQQPVFTYAGTWLNDATHSHFSSFLVNLRTQHGLQGTGEIKGKTLLGSRRGRGAVRALLEELDEHRVPISLVMVHKRFVAAGVVVEDCTDYVYNPEFDERWTWDTTLKEPLAEGIFAVPIQKPY
jgi:Protein of unknown function (DUF3800)